MGWYIVFPSQTYEIRRAHIYIVVQSGTNYAWISNKGLGIEFKGVYTIDIARVKTQGVCWQHRYTFCNPFAHDRNPQMYVCGHAKLEQSMFGYTPALWYIRLQTIPCVVVRRRFTRVCTSDCNNIGQTCLYNQIMPWRWIHISRFVKYIFFLVEK